MNQGITDIELTISSWVVARLWRRRVSTVVIRVETHARPIPLPVHRCIIAVVRRLAGVSILDTMGVGVGTVGIVRARHGRRDGVVRDSVGVAIPELDIRWIVAERETGRALHGPVSAKTILASAHDGIEGYCGEVARQPGDGEDKEGFVGAADLDAGCVAPVLGCAGGAYRAVHAVAHQAEGEGPEEDEDDIKEDGEFGR